MWVTTFFQLFQNYLGQLLESMDFRIFLTILFLIIGELLATIKRQLLIFTAYLSVTSHKNVFYCYVVIVIVSMLSEQLIGIIM